MLRTLLFFTAISLLLFTACNSKNEGKAVYVVTQKVFNEFHGTKELQKKFSSMQNQQKYLLDSLSAEIATLEAVSSPDVKKIDEKKRQYNQFLSQFSKANQEQDQQYMDGIWKQINQYTGEYGKENGYAFIYGANGNGSLMYADSTYDVTNQVIEYINKKYDGK